MACDNISTLRIFKPDFVPEPTQESFDLVCSLWQLVQTIPIRLEAVHVRGHALKRKHPGQLTRMERLNEEMDMTAKAFWNYLCQQGHSMQPADIHIGGEGWTIWHHGAKLPCAHTKVLYPYIEDYKTLAYWTSTHTLQPTPRIPLDAMYHIDWDACGANMDALGFARQIWTAKHASENCGLFF